MSFPRLRADFNAFGGASDESPETGVCYYFNLSDRDFLTSQEGKKVILYDFDSATEITACEAIIEAFDPQLLLGPFSVCHYRACPIEDSWYWGPIPWPVTPTS